MIFLWACAAPLQILGPEPDYVPPPDLPIVPAGVVTDGVYTDSKGFSVHVREGWVATPGADYEQRRLTMDHVPTGGRLEFFVYPEGGIWPRERTGCHWTFEDRGPYGVPPVGGDVTVATCTPRAAAAGGAERVLGWYVLHEGLAWHLEASMPVGYLAPSRLAAEDVLRTLRLP